MTNNYAKCLTEVDAILDYFYSEEVLRIPEEIRNAIKEKKDKEYNWVYDETKQLEEQNLSEDTIAFLSYLNMEYILDEEQKKLMKQIYKFNERKIEEEKSKNYKPNPLFNKQEENIIEETKTEEINTETNEIVSYKENIFTKIINKIKNIFKKK